MKNLFNFHGSKAGFFLGVFFCTIFIASTALPESETPEETLAWSETLANEASDLAFEAHAACDYQTAQRALSIANEAAFLVSKVTHTARDTANQQLAWSAYNASNQVKSAIANVVRAAQHIAFRSPNPEEVHAANVLLELCESEQRANKVVMETALTPFLCISERADAYSKP